MPVRRHRVAVVEYRVRRLLSLPELGRSVTVFVSAASASAGTAAPSVTGSAHSTIGFTTRARGRRVEPGAAGRVWAEEAMWLATTTVFGGWIAELLVPTREAQAVGALVGLLVGARQWRELRR